MSNWRCADCTDFTYHLPWAQIWEANIWRRFRWIWLFQVYKTIKKMLHRVAMFVIVLDTLLMLFFIGLWAWFLKQPKLRNSKKSPISCKAARMVIIFVFKKSPDSESPAWVQYIYCLLSSLDGCITAAGTHKSDCSSKSRGYTYHLTTIASFSSNIQRNSWGYRTSSTSPTTNTHATMASIVSSVWQILI